MGAMHENGRLSFDTLFDEDMLGDDLEDWLDGSCLLKRYFPPLRADFRSDREAPRGKEKTGRQVTISADLNLRRAPHHDPDHILFRATRNDAAHGLLDVRRLGELLSRIRGRIIA